MQLLHTLKLGDTSKLDRLGDAWIRGRVKPGQLRRAMRRTDSQARARLDERLERDRIARLRAEAENPPEAVQANVEALPVGLPWETAEQPVERIVEAPSHIEEPEEDIADGDEELAALFAAIEEIQAGNRERIAAKVKKG